MAYRANTAKSTVYPKRVCETTARHPVVPACGRWLHTAGPWVGGDGRVEDRTLPPLLRPWLASLRVHMHTLAAAATSVVTPMKIAARIARMVVPPLAGVVRVDSRWDPTARTRHATPAIMRTSCVDWRESRAVHVVSVHMSGDARGWARRLRVLRPDCGTGANLSGSRPCPRSSGHTLAARAFERLRTAATAHVWASSVAQTVWRDQCRADGHCKFNLACNAHARVARGGGANRGERADACLTRFLHTRVN